MPLLGHFFLTNTMEIKAKDIFQVINGFAPFILQEEWDNSGLQVGSLYSNVKRVMLTLDVTMEAAKKAAENKIDLIISHHPLIFKPVKCIDLSDETLSLLIKNDVTVISAHTSLDIVNNGVSFALAEALNLAERKILSPKKESVYYKLFFNLPVGYEGKILKELFEEGVGEYNLYYDCAFESFGEGRFKEKSGAEPFIKSDGVYKEARLELIVRKDKVTGVVERLRRCHPYNEVAFDVFKEAVNPVNLGYGCIGEFKKAKKLSQFINHCKEILGIDRVRYMGDLNARVRKVAVCGGSGASFITDAIRAGADVYVTGDLKYHELLENKHKISFVDVGHRASELPVLKKMEGLLKEKFKSLETYIFVEHKDFFGYY